MISTWHLESLQPPSAWTRCLCIWFAEVLHSLPCLNQSPSHTPRFTFQWMPESKPPSANNSISSAHMVLYRGPWLDARVFGQEGSGVAGSLELEFLHVVFPLWSSALCGCAWTVGVGAGVLLSFNVRCPRTRGGVHFFLHVLRNFFLTTSLTGPRPCRVREERGFSWTCNGGRRRGKNADPSHASASLKHIQHARTQFTIALQYTTGSMDWC